PTSVCVRKGYSRLPEFSSLALLRTITFAHQIYRRYQLRSNSSISADLPSVLISTVSSSLTAAASPALSLVPFTKTSPRATCTHTCLFGSSLCVTLFPAEILEA